MKKAESLADLARWAELVRHCDEPRGLMNLPATFHGLNAVRLIKAGHVAGHTADYIRDEARLAFRAALTACGIRGAL
jgi:hypothetical protein